MKYFRLKNEIHFILKTFPETRDNDNFLISKIIKDISEHDLKRISANSFLISIEMGEYGSLESITRCRRKLQEKFPELRGKLWKSRKHLTNEVKNQLRFDFG